MNLSTPKLQYTLRRAKTLFRIIMVGYGWVWLDMVRYGWVWLGMVGYEWGLCSIVLIAKHIHPLPLRTTSTTDTKKWTMAAAPPTCLCRQPMYKTPWRGGISFYPHVGRCRRRRRRRRLRRRIDIKMNNLTFYEPPPPRTTTARAILRLPLFNTTIKS